MKSRTRNLIEAVSTASMLIGTTSSISAFTSIGTNNYPGTGPLSQPAQRCLQSKCNIGHDRLRPYKKSRPHSALILRYVATTENQKDTLFSNSSDVTVDIECSYIAQDDIADIPTLPVIATRNMTRVEEFGRGMMGSVDESRLSFPEYSSGEVPRLFSNLKYDKATSTAVHASGSTFGAAALIAGTAIGAGVLAVPSATVPTGFLPSSGALLVAWAYMVISGLCIAELSLNRIGETGRPGQGLLELYKSYLNENLAKLSSAAYFFLHYAIMVAFLAQGGSNLEDFSSALGFASPVPGQVLFASLCATPLFFGKPDSIQKFNNVLVGGAGLAFLGILTLGIQSADFGALIAAENQHPENVANAFPILFLSLVYQNVVPTVVNQLEGDKRKITTAILCGTAVPLFMCLSWNAVVLGNVMNVANSAMEDMTSGRIDPIALLQSEGHGGVVLSSLVGVFSELAVITTIIGFVYGLLEALTDVAQIPKNGPQFEQYKPLLFAAIFIPPLLLSLGNPDIFYQALEYGGTFGVSTLFLILPPIMIWKLRYEDGDKPLTTMPLVPGGKIPLAGMWKAAGTLVIEQSLDKLGFFEWCGEQFSHRGDLLQFFN